jgi:hypothetical protein
MDLGKQTVIDADLSFLDFYRATLRMSVHVLRYLIGAIVCGLALYILCLIAESMHSSWSIQAEAIGQWISPLLVGAVPTAIVLIPLVAFVRVKMLLRGEGVDGKRRYTFSNEGVRIETRLANGQAKWLAFRQVRESKRYFLLYSAPGLAHVIPKRYFHDNTSMEEFRSLLRAHIKKAKLRK